MTDADITVVVVTHLDDLAEGFYTARADVPALFLRADRDGSGGRPFQLVEAEPRPDQYVYDRIFAAQAAVCSELPAQDGTGNAQ